TKEFYGWDPDKHFYVPDEALEHWRSAAAERAQAETNWNNRFDAYRAAQPGKAAELERIVTLQGPPQGWAATGAPSFDPADTASLATRAASGKTIQWVAANVPELVGGSADLSSSNNTDIDGGGDVVAGDFSGRNLHFGVREHGMGAIVNGLGLHGFRAYGGTFLTFSDYMRGAVRLSAVMKLPSIWVWTHDSIGLGSDGPTHQAVEHVPALRAMPNLSVIRPADANETVLAWEHAVNSEQTPTALILSRQNLPTLDPASIPADAVEKGAYVLRDAGATGTQASGAAEALPDVILIATGSEVQLALAAADLLEPDNIAARVVSMPCEDHFAQQPAEYRDQVLPPSVRARVSIEAASTLGWHRWVGDLGETIGMHSFGASGVAEDLFPHFGFTPERVAEAAREVVKRAQSN
ncbi:MAG: transketolase, partial [Conexibacteraceae bacterium]|nr:transketolase [Conexibacteraceae bacterium]